MHDPKIGFAPLPLSHFLEALATDGHVTVSPYSAVQLVPDAQCANILGDWEGIVREQLSGHAPKLDLAAGLWAVVLFYRACQFLICREVLPETVRDTLNTACPSPRGPSTDYSVDLVFKFMPQLFHLANRLAPEDELVAALQKWAHEWPLSSVGVPLSGAFSIAHFASSPSLLRLYADRLALHHATDRLKESTVHKLIRADLGLYPELDPVLSHALETEPLL